jgi:hypothetical protein
MTPPVTTPPLSALDRARRGELLTGADLAEIFRIKHSRFGLLQKAGAFDAFRVRAPIGRAIYSGVLVQKYLNGEEVGFVSNFGRRTSRRA